MQIPNVINFSFDNKNYKVNNSQKNVIYSLCRLKPQLTSDTVSFTARRAVISNLDRMMYAAQDLLEQHNFKKGQLLYVEGSSYYLPFMNVLSAEAYKSGAKFVDLCVKEPKLEALKLKYGITKEFDYVKEKARNLKKMGALVLKFDEKNDPYKPACVSPQEARAEFEKISPKIPFSVRDLFKINPEEIFKTALDIHKGQPVFIKAEREQLPYVLKLVEYLYSKNKTKLVEVEFPNDSTKNLYKHASDEFLEFIPKSMVSRKKEFLERDVASLKLESDNPNLFGDIDPKRIRTRRKAISQATREYSSSMDTPWLLYYLPTVRSSLSAYPEYKGDGIKALSRALRDAVKINHVGNLENHVAQIDYRAKKMNDLMAKGYRTFHYVSVDPVTKLPDGKTDFKISMSPDSIFQGSRMEMKKFGHNPIVNIPSEEVCSAPLADSAEGVISATMPFDVEGKIVNGVQFRFEKGKVVEIKASENKEVMEEYIANYENADRLGELAIVADSPIKKMNRFFNSVLLDENAACHLALGDSYPDCVKGALEIEDFVDQLNFIRKKGINVSSTHSDFMVGGNNVIITAINPKTGDKLTVVKDDKFLL